MKRKLLYTILIITIILMFAAIFVTVGLTGERDIVDFTDRDKSIFAVFFFTEILLLSTLIVVTALIVRINGKGPVATRTLSDYDKIKLRIDIALSVISVLISVLLSVLGVIAARTAENTTVFALMTAILGILILIFYILNVTVGKHYLKI